MENLPLTEFDLATSGTYMQMIKAYIPFIDLKEQRLISIAIRIAELIQTINFFKNMSEPSPLFRANHEVCQQYLFVSSKPLVYRLRSCGRYARHPRSAGKEIRRFCPGKDFEILDMLSNYSNMSNIISAFQATNEAKESDNNGEVFKKFLSKDQQKLYESYKKILNS